MASSTPPTATPSKTQPKDAQLMAVILKDMGVTEYEPKVINQMLEFTYRYVTDVLEDAKAYSSHASKKTLDVEDVTLAVHSRMDASFATPPPRELLLELARAKNAQPLPPIKHGAGLRLPPDRFCFLSPNFRVKSAKEIGKSVTGTLGGNTGLQIRSSLQANAIQAALGGGRRFGQGRPGPGGVSSSVANKTPSVPRSSLNLPPPQADPQQRGLSIQTPGMTQSSQFNAQQQQQPTYPSHHHPQQQPMMRPGAPTVPGTGIKRKLEDD